MILLFLVVVTAFLPSCWTVQSNAIPSSVSSVNVFPVSGRKPSFLASPLMLRYAWLGSLLFFAPSSVRFLRASLLAYLKTYLHYLSISYPLNGIIGQVSTPVLAIFTGAGEVSNAREES